MFCWEFPPAHSGGLGVACEGIVRGLLANNANLILVFPKKIENINLPCRIIFAPGFAGLSPYPPYLRDEKTVGAHSLLERVREFALFAGKVATEEKFDLIHCHDWLTFSAGINAKEVSGRPLVVHTHALEFDRTGGIGRTESEVFFLEKEGLEKADKVIAVSNWTADKIIRFYGISPEKINIVYNAVDWEKRQKYSLPSWGKIIKEGGGKIVLFLGRLTLQKGPDYFLRAAKRVLEFFPKTYFLIAGEGEMKNALIEESFRLGISNRIFFTGRVSLEEGNNLYHLADCYVMPSVSDPFGITALEAQSAGTPVILSRQTGASEIIHNVLEVDFWDVEKLAAKIIAVLGYPALAGCLGKNGLVEAKTITWDNSAKQCLEVYKKILKNN